ncbi:MAG TPA: hypothetical protein P5181_04335 [Dermatophilaceae bacterium]|nr:hypothetical protein [Dermatophilaceae bacterium]
MPAALRRAISALVLTLPLSGCVFLTQPAGPEPTAAPPGPTRSVSTGGSSSVPPVPSSPSSTAPRPTPSTGAAPAWVAPVTAVSRAAVAGDTILVYVQGDDGYLALVAYDAPTGRERWRRRATTSQQRPELPLGVAVTDAGLVGYLEPGRGGTGTVVLLDPRGAGTVVAQTPTTYPVVSVPSVCAAHAEVICVGVRGQGWQRLGAGQGDLQGFAGLDTGYVERISSNGLVRTMRDGEVRIAALDATHVLWDKSESEVLGTGYSTLGCVGFTYHEATDQFVGTVCRYDGKRPADGTPWAGFTRAVAFARADGRPTWHLDGGDQSCDAPFTRKGADATDPLVLCVWTAGTLRIGADQSDILDPAVELTRVDPASGTSM